MTDIVERLRRRAPFWNVVDAANMAEAATEIKRLRKIEDEWASLSQDDGKAMRELERLRADNRRLQGAHDH